MWRATLFYNVSLPHIQESVHKTDILTVAFGAPHLMATASFCGKVTSKRALYTVVSTLIVKCFRFAMQIVVWSLISYHILNQLKAAYPISSHPPSTCKSIMLRVNLLMLLIDK